VQNLPLGDQEIGGGNLERTKRKKRRKKKEKRKKKAKSKSPLDVVNKKKARIKGG